MSYYCFMRNEQEGVDELRIDGEIVCEPDWWGSSGQIIARSIERRLAQLGDVTVYINSPGGDVFAGAAIYTALREHRARGRGRVTVKITGIAASAASVVAMAGDEVLMSPVSYMMIHDPWTYAAGNAREMEHHAQVLREIGEGLVAAYTLKTGKSRDEITDMLAAETYMNAQKCIDEGFADGLLYEAVPKEEQKASGAMMRARSYGPAAVLASMDRYAGMPKPWGNGLACSASSTVASAVAAASAASCGIGHAHAYNHTHNHAHHTHTYYTGTDQGAEPPDQDERARAEIAERAKITETALLYAALY